MTDDRPQRAPRRAGFPLSALAPWALTVAAAAAWWRERVQVAHLRRPGLSEPAPPAPAQIDRREPGRGRVAPSPFHIPLLGWRDILWRTYLETGRDKLTLSAGSVTYYALLAVFPALGAFVSLYGLFADVGEVQKQLAQLSTIFPPEAVQLVGEQMVRLATGHAANLSAAFVVSLLLSVWSANAGMKALFNALNVAYDEVERRNYFTRTALTYAFTASLLLFLALVSGILVAAPILLEAVGLRTDWLIGARWPLVFLVAATAFTIAYRYGPCRTRARWAWLAPGGAAAALLWMAGSAGFSWYLNHVARLDATYGSLGAIIGFMLWVWFSVMVVLLGAEFSAEIEHQTACDTTVGPPKPIGRRGAAMADTIGAPFVGLRKGAGLVWQFFLRQTHRLPGRRVSPARPPAPPAAPPGPRRSRGR